MNKSIIEFEQAVRRGCGIDVHKDLIVATIAGEGVVEQTRSFGSFTSSLQELCKWLQENDVSHVAMESTSVYWKPVFNILEDHFEILLVNARHIKNVPGHKTDKKDSAWITKLLLSGLLKGSFIPPRPIRHLRDLFRYKKKLSGQSTGERNRIQKILEDANIKVGSVASDIFGVSGMKMLEAIVLGESDAEILASLALGSLRRKHRELVESLTGNITDHHRFMIKTLLHSLRNIESVMQEVDAEIELRMKDYEIELHLLQTIPGVGKQIAGTILAEIGNDMSVFPNQNHLASWAGISPGNNESAGKKKSTRITPGNKMLKVALVEAGWVASRMKKHSFLRYKYESLVGRRGKKRALIAVGHKILCAAYFILRDLVPYQDFDLTEVQEARKQRQILRYRAKLYALGAAV